MIAWFKIRFNLKYLSQTYGEAQTTNNQIQLLKPENYTLLSSQSLANILCYNSGNISWVKSALQVIKA